VRLAPRLVLAFGFLAALGTSGLGLLLREDRATAETKRFADEVARACESTRTEILRQAERDQKLVGGACASGELVDRALVSLEAGDFSDRRLGFSSLVAQERVAFDLDELLFAVSGGDIVGADPKSLLALSKKQVEAQIGKGPASFAFRTDGRTEGHTEGGLAIVARCAKSHRGHTAGLVGARHVSPLLVSRGEALGVTVAEGTRPAREDEVVASCTMSDPQGTQIALTAAKPKAELTLALARIDERILLSAAVTMGVALVIAVLLARSLGRPLSELAREASLVKTDEARPLEGRVKGSGEVRDLVVAFDKMIEDLAVTRRRLAATSRVAAWREVARRVAHEVKNPLAPIRAAVETLRRLRARQDPAFDEYFDEATRTVLDEVHRISHIVTEFTRFARLPQPRPEEVDPADIARHVVSAHEALAEGTRLELVVAKKPLAVRADRDQIVQVLTNLVQNALDSVRGRDGARVSLAVETDVQRRAVFTVTDNGPGLAKEIAARLFEPYATTKAHGTGLGLAIAQRIAIEHDGELSYIGAAEGGGAVFRLVLPPEGPPPLADEPPSGG
jgi:two-component system, NtrC family, nitrogen regulation sensor histidine kinase NtrY